MSMVHGKKDKIASSLELSKAMGLCGSYNVDGAFPDFDHCRYEVAVDMLLHSR
jgi:hypothetical protein